MTVSLEPREPLEPHRRLLWALAYRMTGVAADADDIVQETFARALAKSPKVSAAKPLQPWLVTVTMNLARDTLRRRKRTTYVGPWLPSPVDDAQLEDARPTSNGADAEARYTMRESATFAFLVAIEALTPQRRAVLILRDVFDYSTEETARALGMSNDAVKQSLVRARRSLATYDASRTAMSLDERKTCNQVALTKLFMALATGDARAVEDLLADDVEAHADGGGEFAAARMVLRGPQKVATVYANLTRLGTPTRMDMREMNGATVAVLHFDSSLKPDLKLAPHVVIQVDTNDRGEIVRVYSVMARRKLTAL